MGAIYRAVITAIQDSQTVQNVMYFERINDSRTAQYLAENVQLDWYLNMRTIQSASMFYLNVDVLRWTGSQEEQGIQGFDANSHGDYAGVNMPTQNAVLWSLRSGTTNKRKRGRLYIGGVPTVFNSQSLLSPETQPYHRAAADYWLNLYKDPAPAKGFVWGIWSRANGGVNRPRSEAGFTRISHVLINPRFTHMNSRRVGVGS